ncbi:MAG: hypothetical protein U0169_26335 [Polyangiaceae bacterium]
MKALAFVVSAVTAVTLSAAGAACTPKDPPALTPDSLDPSLQLPDAGDVPAPATSTPAVPPAAPSPTAK